MATSYDRGLNDCDEHKQTMRLILLYIFTLLYVELLFFIFLLYVHSRHSVGGNKMKYGLIGNKEL